MRNSVLSSPFCLLVAFISFFLIPIAALDLLILVAVDDDVEASGATDCWSCSSVGETRRNRINLFLAPFVVAGDVASFSFLSLFFFFLEKSEDSGDGDDDDDVSAATSSLRVDRGSESFAPTHQTKQWSGVAILNNTASNSLSDVTRGGLKARKRSISSNHAPPNDIPESIS